MQAGVFPYEGWNHAGIVCSSFIWLCRNVTKRKWDDAEGGHGECESQILQHNGCESHTFNESIMGAVCEEFFGTTCHINHERDEAFGCSYRLVRPQGIQELHGEFRRRFIEMPQVLH